MKPQLKNRIWEAGVLLSIGLTLYLLLPPSIALARRVIATHLAAKAILLLTRSARQSTSARLTFMEHTLLLERGGEHQPEKINLLTGFGSSLRLFLVKTPDASSSTATTVAIPLPLPYTIAYTHDQEKIGIPTLTPSDPFRVWILPADHDISETTPPAGALALESGGETALFHLLQQ